MQWWSVETRVGVKKKKNHGRLSQAGTDKKKILFVKFSRESFLSLYRLRCFINCVLLLLTLKMPSHFRAGSFAAQGAV